MKYDIILFDADDTLFDFQKTAEKNFKNTCEKLGVPYKDGYYEIYRDINQGYWDLYSVGKVEKAVLKKMRFVDFGKAVGVTINADEFMPIYENGLSEIAILYPDTATVLEKIKNMGIRMFLITNGIAHVQRGRLSRSGIEHYFEQIFISDEVGFSKPQKEFLDFVEKSVKDFDRSKSLIVGDSLVSDIPLGIDNGIDTCYFNHTSEKTDLKITYEITDLKQVLDLL